MISTCSLEDRYGRLSCCEGEVQGGFVGEEKDFEVDAFRDWEPVELQKDRVMSQGVFEQANSRLSGGQEFIQDF